jgi:polygalacturonase
MIQFICALIIWIAAAIEQPTIRSITEFGAVGDGTTLNTEFVQLTVDAVHGAGGGTIRVPRGVFLTGTIELKSNVRLHLENGAVLRGSPDLHDYRRYGNGTHLGVLFAEEAENISITGIGSIDGNGRAFVYPDRVKDLPVEMKRFTRQGEAYLDTLLGVQDGPVVPFEHRRPYQMVLMSGIRNLHIQDINIVDSPFWAVHVADSDGVTIKGVRVRNSLLMPNADGINVTSSRNVVLSDCDIISGDDALAFSGYSVHHELPGYRDIRRLSENVTVSNCILQSRSSGIRVGGIDQNSLRNYRFDNITIYGSNRGIGVFVHQDGSIENLHFSNISIETRLHTGDWWGNGEPIHVSVIEGAPVENAMGRLKNVSFSNIDAIGENGILLYGDFDGAIEDVRFNNVRLTIRNGDLQDTYGGNFDLRPTVDPGKNLFMHDIPGVYIRYATDVSFNDFRLRWDGPMHSNFRHGIWADHARGLRFVNSDIHAPRPTDREYHLVDSTLE